jgi:hypothetical protein
MRGLPVVFFFFPLPRRLAPRIGVASWRGSMSGIAWLRKPSENQQGTRQDFLAIAASRTRLWLASGSGCAGRRLSTAEIPRNAGVFVGILMVGF